MSPCFFKRLKMVKTTICFREKFSCIASTLPVNNSVNKNNWKYAARKKPSVLRLGRNKFRLDFYNQINRTRHHKPESSKNEIVQFFSIFIPQVAWCCYMYQQSKYPCIRLLYCSSSMGISHKCTTEYVPSSKLGLFQPLSRQRVWRGGRGGHSPVGDVLGEF